MNCSKIEKILERFPEDEILKVDGFDAAIIGIEINTMRLIYSSSRCIEILCQQMNHEESVEFFNFNVLGAYVGELTPIFCEDNL